MSVIGKTNTGFVKQVVKESRSIARVAKSLKFAHKANAGETSLNLQSLSAPTEMIANGFVQPSVADLLAAKLLTNRNNLRLKSSIRNIEEFLDFKVIDDTLIQFISPFVALQDEIFTGVISDNVRTGYGLLDAVPFAVTATLAEGTTDISLGVPVPTSGIYGSQIPSILVMRSGVPMVQNVGNSPSGEGNYYLVPQSTGGSSSLLRFNDVGATGGEPVIITPIGNMPFLGTDSMNSVMESVNGAVNAMKPYLADACGVDTSAFGSNPSYSDLRQFGDTVTNHTATLANNETRISAIENLPWVTFSAVWRNGSGVQFTPSVSSFAEHAVLGKILYVHARMIHSGALGGSIRLDLPSGHTLSTNFNDYDCSGSVLIRQNGAGTWPVTGVMTGSATGNILIVFPNSGDFNTAAEQRVMINAIIPLQ